MPTTEHHQNWNVEALWKELTGLLPDISIEVLARAESTNTALLERVRREDPHHNSRDPQPYGRRAYDMQPCLLVAEHQTHGRGRMGRSWLSGPGGSLTFSVGLALDMADWSGLSLAVGCAVAEALDPLPDANQEPRLKLKWPNDIWLDGRKLGGILIETVPAGSKRMAVVGIGLNISELSAGGESTPSSHFSTGFAALDEYRPGISAPEALALIAPALLRALVEFPGSGFAAWRERYARRDLTLGRVVMAGAVEGVSRGVNAGGELMVQAASGQVHAIAGGEVGLRLVSDPPSSPAPLS